MKTIYFNARVYTAEQEIKQAFGVEDGKFFFVGTNEEAKKQPAGQYVDLEGKFVCPGFHDSHMHLLNYGQVLTAAPLAHHTGSLADMLCCLSRTKPGRGGWILGRGWNQDYFSDETRMPNRWDLDRVSLEYPVCAVRACGHALCVNTKALQILGITEDTPQIPGGRIEIQDGQPNGLFFDNAMELVYAAIPSPTKAEIQDMIRTACGKLNAYGITSCQSDDYCVFQNVSWQVINRAFRELEQAGELTVRVYEQANLPKLETLRAFIEDGNRTGTGTDFFRIGPLKLLGDGALGARTAFLSRPYADAPHTRGILVFSPEELDALIGCAHENGMQICVHCIGDACLDLVLDSLEKALAQNPRPDHRHGIVHCQITRQDQLERIAKGNFQVYAQSIFLDYDIHIVLPRAGQELAQTSYRWKTLLDRGVTVSNGSDCPVEAPDVLAGIQCAVTRCSLDGKEPYHKEEAFTVSQALDSYTAASARASFQEHKKGRILPGMLADFVVLDRDPFETDVHAIRDIPVLQTFLGGKPVFG